ncbi:MAG: response regulator [Candidatus Omnitrophica bacterium]|nr:response regulator [Candidatus Omnitrophota bacterium]
MRKQILVCDDEEGIRESLKLILEKDYDLTFAQNGDEAIQKTKASPADITILDIKMPKKDGLETLKELKKINPSSKVIIATGYKSVDIAQEALNLGASDYIVKPFDRDKIRKVVQKYIS